MWLYLISSNDKVPKKSTDKCWVQKKCFDHHMLKNKVKYKFRIKLKQVIREKTEWDEFGLSVNSI